VLGTESVLATEGNLNNHIGLPLTILRASDSHRILILEMGMNHAGEISLLSRIAKPHHALITSVAEAHIEFFKDLKDIARAKLEILDGMCEGGTLLYPKDAVAGDLAEQSVKNRNSQLMNSNSGSTIKLDLFGSDDSDLQADIDGIRFHFHSVLVSNAHYFSRVMASNLLGALLLLEYAGILYDDLIRYVSLVSPATARRFQVHRIKRINKFNRVNQSSGEESYLLADDSYNANEASFLEAVRGLRNILPEGRLGLIAGQMAELGPGHSAEAHRSVGRLAADLGYEFLAVCGNENARQLADAFGNQERVLIFSDSKSLLEKLSESFDIIEGLDGVLVKGSRSARMDIISDALIKK
jgi:UDP-N-acetylmuramoyl-tripeptide--D-alanyl-D-alanine ligase